MWRKWWECPFEVGSHSGHAVNNLITFQRFGVVKGGEKKVTFFPPWLYHVLWVKISFRINFNSGLPECWKAFKKIDKRERNVSFSLPFTMRLLLQHGFVGTKNNLHHPSISTWSFLCPVVCHYLFVKSFDKVRSHLRYCQCHMCKRDLDFLTQVCTSQICDRCYLYCLW